MLNVLNQSGLRPSRELCWYRRIRGIVGEHRPRGVVGEHRRPASSSPSAFAIIGKITSHTAAIGAVLFYFGWLRTHAILDYFGIDPTLISYSPIDYMLRSVNVAFPAADWWGVCRSHLVRSSSLCHLANVGSGETWSSSKCN